MSKTYNDLYLSTRRLLREHGIEAYNLEARIIVAYAAKKPMDRFLRELRLYTADNMAAQVEELVRRRLMGEPVAYLTGRWEFYGLPIDVTPDVLIPRVDTEVLVDEAIGLLTGRKMDARVLDLCAGSGCIGCAIAVRLPATRIVMVDSSREALNVCRHNISLNNIGVRATCIEANAFEAPPMLVGSFDLVVCNPPYIPSMDIMGLDKSVRDYEPHSALDGGDDGLDFFRAVASGWKDIIRDGGTIMFEVGINQAEEVMKILRLNGFKHTEAVKDTAGIDRVIKAKK